MMRWWLDRGVDGFRMDVINFISKDTTLPDGVVTGGLLADGSASYVCGPRIHEFLAEMHQEVFAGRPERLLTVGEMPGVTVEQARDFTDPARAEVDMVFQFEHVGLDHGPGGKFDVRPLRLLDLKASFGRWQAGLADVGWNSLYWDNHDQPRVVSRFGDDGAFRRESATMLATVLHLHRGTPYVYQGEELGMTNAHFTRFDQYRDIETLNHVAVARSVGTGSDEDLLAGIAAMGRDNARTPMQWDDSAARRLHHGHAVDRGQRELPVAERRGRACGPGLGLPLLPPAHRAAARRPGGGARRLHDAPAGPRARVRVHATAGRRDAHGPGQLLGRRSRRSRSTTTPASWCSATTPSRPAPTLRPWEARVHRS